MKKIITLYILVILFPKVLISQNKINDLTIDVVDLEAQDGVNVYEFASTNSVDDSVDNKKTRNYYNETFYENSSVMKYTQKLIQI